MPDSFLLLIAGALLAVAVVLYLLHPLVRGYGAPVEDDEDPRAAEEAFRRDTALAALRDAEYDFVTGKLDEDDYRNLRGELAREALALLGESEVDEAGEGEGEGGEEDEGRDERLEEEIARIRQGLQEGRTCRSCAHLNPEGSRFCGRCGTALGPEHPAGVGARDA